MSHFIQRYVWLIDTIKRFQPITLAEISTKWGMSILNDKRETNLPARTFHKHREEILRLFGIEITCDKSSNTYSIKEDDHGYLLNDWLFDTIMMGNIAQEAGELGPRMQIEKPAIGVNCLLPIVQAMKTNTAVEIRYMRYLDGIEKSIVLYPYFAKSFHQRWYVIGATENHPDQIRIFALDRIIELKDTEKTFTYPENFSPEDYFSNYYGIFHTEGGPENVTLKVGKLQSNFVRSLPFHHTQVETVTEDDYSIFRMHMIPTEDFEMDLLSRGNSIEVLEPDWLREEMHVKIKSMLAVYE